MTGDIKQMSTREVLARTLWGEARGEGIVGMAAVACVIVNRAKNPRWWGKDIAGVCTKPMQFSCWNDDDPNKKKLLTVDITDKAFDNALRIADEAISGKLIDITGGSDHYHTKGVAPVWSKDKTPQAVLGVHKFFKLELK